LLDTAVFILAAAAPERFTKRAASVLADPENTLELSTMARLLPFTAAHAFHLFGLPSHHKDPFDRQIISQALAEGIAIVTPDESPRLYEGVKVIW